MVTLTEDIVLLLLDNENRPLSESADVTLGYAICGALMIDLAQQGFLDLTNDTVTPTTEGLPEDDFLAHALSRIRQEVEPENTADLVKTLYADIARIKHEVLDSLVRKGYVKVEEIQFTWSFKTMQYKLKSKYEGRRKAIIKAVMNGEPVAPTDFVSFYFADACRLFDDVMDNQTLNLIAQRLGDIVESARLSQAVSNALDKLIPTSAELQQKPKRRRAVKGKMKSTWEWRAFWTQDNNTIPINRIAGANIDKFRYSELLDRYLLIPGRSDNIKVRKNGLAIKQLIESYNGAAAFRPKETHKFPIQSEELYDIFPRLQGVREVIQNLDELNTLLRKHGYKPTIVDVAKARYTLHINSTLMIELCSLTLEGTHYWSACVEGPDYDTIMAQAANILADGAEIVNYVDFLNRHVPQNGKADYK